MKKLKLIRKEETELVTKKNVGATLVAKIQNQEDQANAVIRSSHQFYLLIQSLLKDQFNFDDKDLKDLNKSVTKAVEGLAYFEEKGLLPLSAGSLDQLVEVTQHHYEQLKADRAGIFLPTDKKAAKLLMDYKDKK